MTIAAHPTPPLLAAYSNGSLCEGMSLLLACHLTYCPGCRGAVGRLEALGGALLADAPPEPVDPARLATVLARIDASERSAGAPPDIPGSPLPAPLRHRLSACGSAIRWRFRMPGFAEHRIDGFATEQVSLYRARPGVRMPAHTHSGQEGTLVLRGRMRDGPAELGPGDLALADERDDHQPEIVGHETCLCLAVQTGRMHFTGPLGRILNLLPG